MSVLLVPKIFYWPRLQGRPWRLHPTGHIKTTCESAHLVVSRKYF
jgi:hypothetical protein